jgi:hypothetical protein
MNQHIPKFLQVSYNLSICFIFFCLYIKTRSSYPEIYPERSDEDEDGGYDLSRESQFI